VTELHLTRRQKEDPVVVAWARFQDWFLDNIRIVLAAVGIVLAVVVIGGLWFKSRADAETKASGKLAEASALYWRGEYGPLSQRAIDIRQNYQGTKAAAEATRMLGDAYFWQGDFKKAVDSYNEYLTKIPASSPMRPGVDRSIAQAYESQRQFKEAAAQYEKSAKEFSSRMDQADMYMSAGRAYEAMSNFASAKTSFQKVADEYADTPFSNDAEMKLGEIQGQGR
jgi:predicted negative regulator of RcsB-dependent stress response